MGGKLPTENIYFVIGIRIHLISSRIWPLAIFKGKFLGKKYLFGIWSVLRIDHFVGEIISWEHTQLGNIPLSYPAPLTPLLCA